MRSVISVIPCNAVTILLTYFNKQYCVWNQTIDFTESILRKVNEYAVKSTQMHTNISLLLVFAYYLCMYKISSLSGTCLFLIFKGLSD